MNTTTLASSKFMNGKAIGIAAAAAIIVLAIIGWTAGWFGGETPATTSTAPAVTTEQPAAPAAGQDPAQPAAGTSTNQ